MKHNMELKMDFLNFIDKCAKKEKDAWNTFVERYCNLIYHYILITLKRYVHPFQGNEVNDIFSNIFFALLDTDCKRLKDFRGENERSFRAYLREICFHITIDYLRKCQKFTDLEEIKYCISDKDNFAQLDHRDLKEIIATLRAELPARHKYIFKLIYEEELDPPEIAEVLNMKVNAFHQLKFRMIKNIIKIAKKKKLYQELEAFIIDRPVCGFNELRAYP